MILNGLALSLSTLCLVTCGLLVVIAQVKGFWRWAGRLKRWLRDDLERKYSRAEADEILGPPLPYEFFE